MQNPEQTIHPTWPAPANIKAITTTKQLGSFQDAKTKEELVEKLNLPNNPIWLQQEHKANVIYATNSAPSMQTADASYTDQPNTICAIITADCLPILLCNAAGTKVAAIHAGWKSLAKGIIQKTIAKLNTENLMAWLGPAIGPQKFEVGKDVYDSFPKQQKAFTRIKPDKWLANIYQIATQILNSLQVNKVYCDNFCTYTDAQFFYSYRRDGNKTGRMASLIWIQDEE